MKQQTAPSTPWGGFSGLLNLEYKDGILTDRRDIVLGKNVPGFPGNTDQAD